MEKILDLLVSRYPGSDMMSNIPTCKCGTTTTLNADYVYGTECFMCGETVKAPESEKIESNVWMRHPTLSAGGRWVSPRVWSKVNDMMQGSVSLHRFSFMRWVTTPNMQIPKNLPAAVMSRIRHYQRAGWNRTIANLVSNYDEFLDILRKAVGEKRSEDITVLRKFKDSTFSTHLPMPTRIMQVFEDTPVGKFTEKNMPKVIDAALAVVSLSRDDIPRTVADISSTASEANDLYADYTHSACFSLTGGKGGLLRGQLYRSRSDWCGRAVITSINEDVGRPLQYSSLHLPWKMAVELLRVHISSILLYEGKSQIDIEQILMRAMEAYDPIIHQLMLDLIDEGPLVNVQRNPSLPRCSTQALVWDWIKTDTSDDTVSVNPLLIQIAGGDFDGDEENLYIGVTTWRNKMMRLMLPYFGHVKIGAGGTIDGRRAVPDAAAATIANYVNRGIY